MYYREGVIDGVLYCKFTPKGKWRKVSIKQVTAKLIDARTMISELEKIITKLNKKEGNNE